MNLFRRLFHCPFGTHHSPGSKIGEAGQCADCGHKWEAIKWPPPPRAIGIDKSDGEEELEKNPPQKPRYRLIEAVSSCALVPLVNESMKEGYLPLGAPGFAVWGGGGAYTQAMYLPPTTEVKTVNPYGNWGGPR